MVTSTVLKLGGFAVAVGVVFAGAYGIGAAVGPIETPPPAPMADGGHGMGGGEDDHGGGDGAAHTPAGLQVAERGYALKVLTTGVIAGVEQDFAFQITRAGKPVTAFQVNHDKLMHLIVARRDLSGFRHVHPTMSPDGTWRIPYTFAEGGQFRVFADFLAEGEQDGLTLGADVPASGNYQPRPLPEPSDTATVDGYTVKADWHGHAGESAKLTLSVHKGGQPVTDLQPYLGAYGHLVALRDGDLAYLHVHPEESATAGPEIKFVVEVPSAGDYRFYLDFQHNGTVRTAEFTMRVGEKHQ